MHTDKRTRQLSNRLLRAQRALRAEQQAYDHLAQSALKVPCASLESCPTYYDGCNCTVECLVHNIDRAEVALAERDALRSSLTAMTAERDRLRACLTKLRADGLDIDDLLAAPVWTGKVLDADGSVLFDLATQPVKEG